MTPAEPPKNRGSGAFGESEKPEKSLRLPNANISAYVFQPLFRTRPAFPTLPGPLPLKRVKCFLEANWYPLKNVAHAGLSFPAFFVTKSVGFRVCYGTGPEYFLAEVHVDGV